MKLTKRIIAAAAVFAAAMTLFVGCKGLLGNADDVESKGKREQSATEKKGAIDSQTYTRFYKQFGKSENVYAADCDITLTGSKKGSSSAAAAGFMFGIHTDKDDPKKMSAFVAAVRVSGGVKQYYVSHFTDFQESELTSSTIPNLGTEDATWTERSWQPLDANSYTYDIAKDILTVKISVVSDTNGDITVKVGNKEVKITKAAGAHSYDGFKNKVDVEKVQTKTKGCVIGKIASYGVIYPTNANPANSLTAKWKVSNDKVTVGALFAEEE
ncbi:hypothetical protein HRI97_11495 [Treponema socranskii subsp. buccale]|uniref:hypothetical protein n=1 Tax=Treponema socranskii TaxID=53419 RepID=UPI0020A388B4|nr:hypothetical protein [Treponema socranskii]UTD03631.1 hypothetical protein HRI97_11495 [Treponema socranskii subsp. buccale]